MDTYIIHNTILYINYIERGEERKREGGEKEGESRRNKNAELAFENFDRMKF